jgi:hypothetical protein
VVPEVEAWVEFADPMAVLISGNATPFIRPNADVVYLHSDLLSAGYPSSADNSVAGAYFGRMGLRKLAKASVARPSDWFPHPDPETW